MKFDLDRSNIHLLLQESHTFREQIIDLAESGQAPLSGQDWLRQYARNHFDMTTKIAGIKWLRSIARYCPQMFDFNDLNTYHDYGLGVDYQTLSLSDAKRIFEGWLAD